MNKTWKQVLVPAIAAAVSASSLVATALPASASTKPTYTIAYEGPLSGGNAQLGLNMEYAVELAINEANAGTSFGALPFTLQFKAADDQGSPSATAPILAHKGWHNFFRVVADDNAQGPADATFVDKKLMGKSVYSVDDGSTYAAGLVTAFNKEAKTLGLKVTHQTALATSQCGTGNTGDVSQYPALATTIKSTKDPVTFYAGYYCDFALLAKALRTAGYTGTLLSDDGSLDPHYVSEAGAKVANGTYISCACATLGKTMPATAFATAFQKLAKFPVGTYSAESFDSTNTIIAVMKSLGANVTRKGVVNGLHKVTYKGLTKTIFFQADGNIAGTAVYIYQVKSGKIGVVGLAP